MSGSPRHRDPFTVPAEPLPRRTGSARRAASRAAGTRSPVAAPISAVGVNVWPERRQRRPRPSDERRLGRRPPRVLRCDGPGRGDRLRQASCRGRAGSTRICSTVVMIVDAARASRPRGTAGRAAARSSAPSSCAAACRAPGRFGSGAVPWVGGEVEVGQLVVEQEAAARHDHRVAADLLDGERVLDDVAPLVGDGQVGRGLPVVGRGAARCAVAQPRTSRPATPGATGLASARARVDQAGPLGREPVGEQRVEQRRAACRRRRSGCGRRRPARWPPGSGAAPGSRSGRARSERSEDVERLADGRAAAGRGGHAVHVEPAVARPGSAPAQRTS